MIWLMVGEEYDLVGKSEDTPCRMRDGSMTTLDKAKESGESFDVWVGYWEDACLANSVYAKGTITLSFAKDKILLKRSERDDLEKALADHLNDKDFLFALGLYSISVVLE